MSIIISPQEIKINGIPVSELANIGFEYKYLYYEPLVPNFFKIFNGPDGNEYKVNLSDDEKTICSQFLDSWIAPQPVEAPQEQQVQPTDDEYVSIVSEDGRMVKVIPKSQLKGDEILLTAYQVSTRYVESWQTPSMIWNQEKQEFEGVGPIDKRIISYMTAYNFGDQFDLMWKALSSIKDSGIALPPEVEIAMAKMQEIKSTFPK